MLKLEDHIRLIPDYPKPGIQFRDITPLLANRVAFNIAIDKIVSEVTHEGLDAVAGIDARGFIFGAAVASALGLGFIPIRKSGKLPGNVISESYDLEYGQDTLEISIDDVEAGQRVLLIDDLIATGGTALAALKLLKRCELDVVGASFVVDLPSLGGSKKIIEQGTAVSSLISYAD
ncbi:adenine phosphoribosyltransferase [Litorimonas taeanensis]|uniref:Adenine phosphoribosyltransferase n=1 Tax=Litorimonas taeanensis TaxID=568099 RepID=A0A420WJX5_9PROT|nr:adenine phosphoribosyltransferase [Litorimonas taeanensis]RKQ71232.1 adenine phosphoribosyltransferase [Litorimonas taeanensis]